MTKVVLCQIIKIQEDVMNKKGFTKNNSLAPFGRGLGRGANAFTLAEVLITLGVIGVVSAMTLPSVINKFRVKALETGFKKSYSNISKAVLHIKNTLEIDDLWAYCTVYDSSYINSEECKSMFYNNLGAKDKAKPYTMYNYNATKSFGSNSEDPDYPNISYILPDGSGIGVDITSWKIYIFVDVNGYRKPNKIGHDIFCFAINNKSDSVKLRKQDRAYTEEELKNSSYAYVTGSPCNKDSKQILNGIGCAWYAFNNVNPDDETKTYWDNLPR